MTKWTKDGRSQNRGQRTKGVLRSDAGKTRGYPVRKSRRAMGSRSSNAVVRLVSLATLVGLFAGAIWAAYSTTEPSVIRDTPVALNGDAGAPAKRTQEVTDNPPRATVSKCVAVDGDTLRCAGERIRLLGIDTPEMEGQCRPGRRCVDGDPEAAKRALSSALGREMTIERVGHDHYGRTLALVEGPRGDLSCLQLQAGHANYREDWDNGGRLSARCPAA